MHKSTKAKHNLGDIETDWVHSNGVVRKGCILSPVLFALYTEELAVRVRESNLGIRVGNERLSILMYADDIIIMSESSEELQQMLNVVSEYSLDFGVKFGVDKNLIMVLNGDEDDIDKEWKPGECCVKRKYEYKYLGVTLNIKECEKAKSEKMFEANQC